MKLFETQFGSTVYGIVTPESDVDIGVVALESPLHIFGLQDAKDFPQVQNDRGEDIRKFWLKRFIRLCVRGNPNALEWLYTPQEHILYCHPLFYEHIIENAHLFLDMDNIIQSHLGFAKSQIVKMKGFSKKLSDRENEIGAKRRALIERHGYDVKYASHAIRLIYQLTDLLEGGTILLPYEDEVRAELLAIKTGEVPFEEFDNLYEDRLCKVEYMIDMARSEIDAWKPNQEVIARILETMYRLGW
jgi:predicted nucleotidyltransferase